MLEEVTNVDGDNEDLQNETPNYYYYFFTANIFFRYRALDVKKRKTFGSPLEDKWRCFILSRGWLI